MQRIKIKKKNTNQIFDEKNSVEGATTVLDSPVFRPLKFKNFKKINKMKQDDFFFQKQPSELAITFNTSIFKSTKI